MVKTLQKLYVFAVSSKAYQNCLTPEEQAQFAENVFEIMDLIKLPPPESTKNESKKEEAQ